MSHGNREPFVSEHQRHDVLRNKEHMAVTGAILHLQDALNRITSCDQQSIEARDADLGRFISEIEGKINSAIGDLERV